MSAPVRTFVPLLSGGWYRITPPRGVNAVLGPLRAIVAGSGFHPKKLKCQGRQKCWDAGEFAQSPDAFSALTALIFCAI